MRLIIIGIGVFIAILIIIWLLPFGVIQAGQRGVVFNNFTGLEKGRILPEGTYWRTPFAESVTELPVRTQKSDFTEEAGTSDSQIINTNLTVNWHIDAGKVDNVYDQIGSSIDVIESTVFTNNVKDAVKAAVSKYQALEVQRNRDNVTTKATEVLQNKVKKYHIIIDGISITNIQFSAQFTQAIENAVTAEQNAKAAENKVAQAKAEADQTIATAQGQAEAYRLQQQALTPELLEKQWIEKWSGNLPQYSFGGIQEPLPIFNVNK